MSLSFETVVFPSSLAEFAKIHRLANFEISGENAFDINNITQYIEKTHVLFGEQAFTHIYLKHELIGQIELGTKLGQGYVHLFYLLPKYRGKGYFKQMHEKMLEIMRSKRFTQIKILIPPSNNHVINVYQHYGWVRYGFDNDKPEMLCFMLTIT